MRVQAEHAEQQQLAREALDARHKAMLQQQNETAAEMRAFKEHASGLLSALQTQASVAGASIHCSSSNKYSNTSKYDAS